MVALLYAPSVLFALGINPASGKVLQRLSSRSYPNYLPKELPATLRKAEVYFSWSHDVEDDECYYPGPMMQNVTEYLGPDGDAISECRRAIQTLLRDRINRENYAVRMLDAGGRRESGLRVGNHKWWGSYQQCQNSYSDDVRGRWCYVGVGFTPGYQARYKR